MNALNQIANHLKIDANKIKRCEEWTKVWFVVIQGKGARFVSKKVVSQYQSTNADEVADKFATDFSGDYNFSDWSYVKGDNGEIKFYCKSLSKKQAKWLKDMGDRQGRLTCGNAWAFDGSYTLEVYV